MKGTARLIGEKIKDLRSFKGWRQRDLARKSALPVRTIGRIERGEVDVRISTLAKIATALGTSPKKILS